MLWWAAGVVAVQVVGELVAVGGRAELTVGLRVMLGLVLALQLLLAALVLRLSAGSVLGLFAYEAMAIVAAIGSPGALALRLALAFSAIAAIVLLARSLPLFPTPAPPKVTR